MTGTTNSQDFLSCHRVSEVVWCKTNGTVNVTLPVFQLSSFSKTVLKDSVQMSGQEIVLCLLHPFRMHPFQGYKGLQGVICTNNSSSLTIILSISFDVYNMIHLGRPYSMRVYEHILYVYC